MRRTHQEFKAEIFRRSSAYRQRRRVILQNSLTAVTCVVLVILGIRVLPWGRTGAEAETLSDMVIESAQEAPAAAEEPAMGNSQEIGAEHTVASAVCVERIRDGAKKHLKLGEGEYLIHFLAEAQWDAVNHQCTSEYVITDAFGKPYGYNPECNALYDPAAGLHSEPLPEELREILDKYCQ